MKLRITISLVTYCCATVIEFGPWLDVKIFNLGLSKTPLLQPAHACEFHQPIKDKSAQAGPSKHLRIKGCLIFSHSSVFQKKSANGPSDTDLPLSKSNPLRMIQWHTTRCSNTITIYTQARLLHTN